LYSSQYLQPDPSVSGIPAPVTPAAPPPPPVPGAAGADNSPNVKWALNRELQGLQTTPEEVNKYASSIIKAFPKPEDLLFVLKFSGLVCSMAGKPEVLASNYEIVKRELFTQGRTPESIEKTKYFSDVRTLLRESKEAKIVSGCKDIIKKLSIDSSKQGMVDELRAILAMRKKKKEDPPTESKQGGDDATKPQPLQAQEKVLN